jgi:hypothetical protein
MSTFVSSYDTPSRQVLILGSAVLSVKVRAAEAIFNHAAKVIEIEDIEVRVAALEAAAARRSLFASKE